MSTINRAPQFCIVILSLLAGSVACSNEKHDTTSTQAATPPTAAPATPEPTAKARPLTDALKQGLEGYDANHNGVLDPSEKEQMDKDRKDRIEALKARINARYDRNNNGVLEPSEEQAMQTDTDKLSVFKGSALRRYDADHDGKLDQNERARMVSERNAFLTNMQAKLLPAFDKNHDGRLDSSERLTMERQSTGAR